MSCHITQILFNLFKILFDFALGYSRKKQAGDGGD